jgi:hypothetical protein
MSISMLIRSTGEKRRDLPVATKSMFNDYWVPQSRRLGLDRIVQFDYGADVAPVDIPEIVSQLEVLAASLNQQQAPDIPGDVAAYMRERIAFLTTELKCLDATSIEEFSIG